MGSLGTGKHKRRVFFVRHLAKVPKSTFAAYPGCIVIAAGGLKPVDADASLFSFENVFRYDANGLALDLDAVTLRFEERAAASKPPLKPNKAMLAKMKSLANHLKTIAVGFMRARQSGTEDAYVQVAKDMAKVTMSSLEKFFASDDAPCKISFAQRPAQVSFWAEVCRRAIRYRRSLLVQNLHTYGCPRSCVCGLHQGIRKQDQPGGRHWCESVVHGDCQIHTA